MITIIILNISVVLFAYFTRYRQFRFGLEVSFFLIFIFLALRYNFGNDYRTYLNSFLDINRFIPIDLTFKSEGFEPGWILLCRVFKPLGFFAMTAVLALISSFIYYRFIIKYVPPKYYWVAVFLYVFSPGFMLIHSSAMRQAISISLFIFSLDYLFRKDAIRYFLCVAIASLFHTSALILIPVYFLGFVNQRMNIVYVFIMFITFFLFFYFGKYFLPQISDITGKYFPRYMNYQGGTTISTGFGVLFLTLLLILTLYYSRFQKGGSSLLFRLALISFIFIPLGLTIAMLSRVGMYFQVTTIAVFPIILINVRNVLIRNSITILILFFTLYTFFQFFQSETWRDYFSTYQTIFSAPEIY